MIEGVYPLGPERTKVSFLSYVWDKDRQLAGVGPDCIEWKWKMKKWWNPFSAAFVPVFTIAADIRRGAKPARTTSTSCLPDF